MFYREAGQFKTSYRADQAIFPITQDKLFVLGLVIFMYVVPPLFLDAYWLKTIFTQVFVFAVAAIGLNLLTGYCGQISLGSAGFMGAGAFGAFKFATWFPDLNIFIVIILGGLSAALVGLIFGLPSLRIKGFYLAVATLAAQFFLQWSFTKAPWLYNYSTSGTITAPPRTMFGVELTGGAQSDLSRYLVTLTIVVILAMMAKNLVRGRLGRAWMAIRDMDIAAELIGIRPLQAKLSAFAISSFYCGIAGAMFFFFFLDSLEGADAFQLNVSFNILFMVILGGLGSILGSFLGAAFITLLPILLTNLPHLVGLQIDTATQTHLERMIYGVAIVFFLIVEPHGLARLWQIAKEKLRLWPFPH